MRENRAWTALALFFLVWSPATAQELEATTPPIDVDLQEQVEVHLVLIDVLVLDARDRTVPDLAIDDFQVLVDRRRLPIDTLDVNCAGDPIDDAVAVRRPKLRNAMEHNQQPGRKIAIALDYLHLTQIQRVDVLEDARDMVRNGIGDNDQVMVAALNGGLRIELPFTADRERIAQTLKRMEYDISLWRPEFPHLNEFPFFSGMQALLDVLTNVNGPKALVLYSNSQARANEYDQNFARLAAIASSARCSIYPVQAAGLTADPLPG